MLQGVEVKTCFYPVRNKYGTAKILGLAILAGMAAGNAMADVASDATASELGAPIGSYAPGDGAALQSVLDAPGLSGAADATLELAPELKMQPASLRNAPAPATQAALENRGFDAWDMKNGAIVPEPATALLMGAGLAALAVYRGMRGKVITD
jgi:hypothetical protein